MLWAQGTRNQPKLFTGSCAYEPWIEQALVFMTFLHTARMREQIYIASVFPYQFLCSFPVTSCLCALGSEHRMGPCAIYADFWYPDYVKHCKYSVPFRIAIIIDHNF